MLVALNIYVTYFLLVSTRFVIKRPTKGVFIAAASILGGFSSLTVLAENLGVLGFPLKLLFGAAIVAIAFLPKKLGLFLKEYAAFLAVSFVFGGIMLFFEYVLHPKKMVFINGTLYFDVSVTFIAVMSLVCYVAVIAVDRIFKKRAAEKTLYKVKVVFRGKSVVFTALYDTGNTLTDGIEGKPVIIAEKKSVMPLFSGEEIKFFSETAFSSSPPESLARFIRAVPGKSVCGDGILAAFIPQKILISDGKTVCKTTDALIALADVRLSSDYEGLLNGAIFERSEKTDEIF